MSDAKTEKWTSVYLSATGTIAAHHELITELERSKNLLETSFDLMPTAQCVVMPCGRILKSNQAIANLFDQNLEQVMKNTMSDLFREEDWKVFQNEISKLDFKDSTKIVDFELPISTRKGELLEHLWTVRPFLQFDDDSTRFYQVVGQDISSVRKIEKKIFEIFSSLPLGILTLDADSKISGPDSPRTRLLLDSQEINGVSIFEILFNRCLDQLSANEVAALEQIKSAPGSEEFWFEYEREIYPKELCLPCSNNGEHDHRWLGVTYHPIVEDEKIKNLLLVIEDKTAVVHARIESEKNKNGPRITAQRFSDLQNCPKNLLKTSIEEFQDFMRDLALMQENFNSDTDVFKILHSLKGVARTAGFKQLAHITHQAEEGYQKLGEINDEEMIDWVYKELTPIGEEIKQILQMYKALFSESNTSQQDAVVIDGFYRYFDLVQSEVLPLLQKEEKSNELLQQVMKKLDQSNPTQSALDSYEPAVRERVKQTLSMVGKEVEISFDWNDVKIDRRDFKSFGEIALHLLNNAIDHGLEDNTTRVELGKPKAGQLHVEAKKMVDGSVQFVFSDDGKGIEPEMVAKSAIGKKLLTEQEAEALSDADKIALILHPDFSTADSVSLLSGRGVGMGAVVSIIEDLGGHGPLIDSKVGKGTKFTFTIYDGGKRKI